MGTVSSRSIPIVACALLVGCGGAGQDRDGAASTRAVSAAAATPAPAAAAPERRHVPRALAELLARRGPRLVAGVPFGRSARGRRLRLTASGNPAAARRVLLVGCIHGDECAGMAVARRVLRGPAGCPPTAADLWVVPDLDPDGRATGSRLNGHGVDLNRNFPAGWRPIGRPGDLEHSGPHPFSEPETRAVRAVIRAGRPQVTIWYHQQAEALIRAWGPSVPAARRYARLARLPFRRLRWLSGTAPHWQNTALPGAAAFVVELAPGRLGAADVTRHARAVLALAGVGLAGGRGRG
jgi:murein peptide amidase A